jgi:hypothetical protein
LFWICQDSLGSYRLQFSCFTLHHIPQVGQSFRALVENGCIENTSCQVGSHLKGMAAILLL